MKHCKKILALIMSVLMIVSVMPVAFAADCEHELNMSTLVRPSDNENKGYYVCAKCGEDIVVNRPDYSDFWDVIGEIEAIIEASSLYNPKQGAILEEYAYKIIDTAEIRPPENFFNLIEQEQDVVDTVTANYNAILEELKTFADKNGYKSPYNLKDYVTGLLRADFCNFIYGISFKAFIEELPKETQQKINETVAEAEEIFDKIFATNAVDDITEEDIILLNGAYAKLGAVYNNVCNCIENKHNPGKLADNGEGNHVATCDLCGEIAINEEHNWSEFTPDVNNNPCHKKDSMTATCADCGARNTVELESAGVHVNKDHDDFCDICDERIVERCPFCDELAHKDYMKYVCMLVYYLNLLVNLVKSF